MFLAVGWSKRRRTEKRGKLMISMKKGEVGKNKRIFAEYWDKLLRR